MDGLLDKLVRSSLVKSSLPGSIFITAADAEKTALELGVDAPGFLAALLKIAPKFSKPVISHFPVGAVAMGLPDLQSSLGFGNVYLGASFEVKGESLSVVVHGEQAVIQNAWSHGELGLQIVAINAPPCGYCRQFMWEVTDRPTEIQVLLMDTQPATSGSNYTLHKLADLLPIPFGPADLKFTRSLLAPQTNAVNVAAKDELEKLALAGAQTSYSPYTSTFCAVALEAADGTLACGRYAENAAYNPSMSPMMAALSQLNLSQAPGLEIDIVRAVMIETKTLVSLEQQSRSILTAISPNAQFDFISA